MDDWHRKLAERLIAHTRVGGQTETESALEVAFGQARAAIAYVLEFARAHRVAVTGNVGGDDVWVQLGAGPRARFLLNRREAQLAVWLPGDDGRVLRWDAAQKALVDPSGSRVDLSAAARAALDALVAEWSSHPAFDPAARADGREFEDEPTKG
jgi:hypothetical protein